MPFKDPVRRRNYYKKYMRAYRQKGGKPNQLRTERQLTDAWEKVAEKVKTRSCCLCKSAEKRYGITDEAEIYFVCRNCIEQGYEALRRRLARPDGGTIR
jgi:hypothetical protein